MNLHRAYLAGVADSDGSFIIRKRLPIDQSVPHYNSMFQICWSDTPKTRKVLDYLVNTYGGTITAQKAQIKMRHRYKKSRPFLRYCITGKGFKRLVTELLPFLALKVKQAEACLVLCGLMTGNTGAVPPKSLLAKKEKLHHKVKDLNRKNSSITKETK